MRMSNTIRTARALQARERPTAVAQGTTVSDHLANHVPMTAPHESVEGLLRVHVSDEHDDDEAVDLASLGQIALNTLQRQGVTNGQIDLILIDRDEMASLNHAHMGQDGPTDVLSFPLDLPLSEAALSDAALSEAARGHGPVHLGDIVISPVVARAQAATHAGTNEAEFALLTIHGVLHILGHDHAELDETLVMQALERDVMASLGFEHPVKL